MLNPKKLYIKNLVCYEGKDSLKTTFINLLNEYIDVSIVPVNLIQSQFNGYMDNPICVYEELPASIKEARTVMEQIKAMTSTRKISLHKKGENSRTIENYCNIIINTNHKEVGGLFDNQNDSEMFKRFYIIAKQPIERSLINEFFQISEDEKNIAACFELVKQLKPLALDEINDTRTQEEYYSFVRNTQNNKQCLRKDEMDRTIRYEDKKKRYWLKIGELTKLLKQYGLPVSKESERQQLIKLKIIKDGGNSNFQIVDLERYYIRYHDMETPSEQNEMYEHLEKYFDYKVENRILPNLEEDETEQNNTFPNIVTDSSSSSSSSSDEL